MRLVGVTGVEPILSESKSDALPLCKTPMFADITALYEPQRTIQAESYNQGFYRMLLLEVLSLLKKRFDGYVLNSDG